MGTTLRAHDRPRACVAMAVAALSCCIAAAPQDASGGSPAGGAGGAGARPPAGPLSADELRHLASSGKFKSKPIFRHGEGTKFDVEKPTQPLTREVFVTKFAQRIADSPTTMDPDQVFRALDADRDGLVAKEELTSFRIL
eukprot:COSAG04_NODE_11730_length_692_cov_0.856661_1_plen_140_part_00